MADLPAAAADDMPEAGDLAALHRNLNPSNLLLCVNAVTRV
jgi:hypothetical protein